MKKNRADYQVIPFPKTRHVIVELLARTQRRRTVHALLEMDVTQPRQHIREHKARTGETLSFTAFIATCLGKAVDENKKVHAYRKGRNQLLIFDDVDIDILVEREIEGIQIPLVPLTIRAANKKSFREIHHQIRATQVEEVGKTYTPLKWYLSLPGFITRFITGLFWSRFLSDPRLRKKIGGTVSITAVGMFGTGGGWALPITNHTLAIALGGIGQKPGVVDGRIEIREYLSMTISFDHDIVDGAPAARFTQRLKELIESGYGLGD